MRWSLLEGLLTRGRLQPTYKYIVFAAFDLHISDRNIEEILVGNVQAVQLGLPRSHC